MTSLSPALSTVLAVLTCVSVALTARPGAAQTGTPHSAFSLTTIPQLERQVWPGDFNRDGRTDLVGSAGGASFDGPTDLLVAIARSDRSFPAPRSLGIAADAIAVSDLNRDGFQDLVIRTPASIAVMPGNGDGTFRAPRPVHPAFGPGPYPAIAIVNDFTGDGHRDIAIPASVDEQTAMRVLPGRGDFTFGTPIDTAFGIEGAVSAIAGDFNGDGRPDLAVIPLCCSLYVLLNNRGLGFSVSQVPLPGDLADITTGDLDGDGDLDLVVTLYFPMSSMPGEVGVLLGNGAGAFSPPAWFESGVKGEFAVVVGDFTGDGVLDVATGNQSAFYMDDQGTQMSDSVSVLEGDGTGGLGPAVSFPITYSSDDGRYQHTLHFLNTNDINRDGVPDLIASPGAIFLSRPPVPNRPPHAFAGPDRTVGFEDGLVLGGSGSDPDGHWVDYRWTDAAGRVIARHPTVFFGGLFLDIGTWTYTLTVTDSLGAVAVDSVTIRVTGYGNGAGLEVPGFGESIPLGEPYVLRFGAAEVFTRIDLSYSPDGGETFTPIAECTGLVPSVRECTWLNPAPASDRALLRLVATGPGVEPYIQVSLPFRIVAPAPAGALPAGWQNGDVGAVGAVGNARFDAGTFTVRGAGADVWGTADEFHFVRRAVPLYETTEVVARVAFVGNVNQWTKAGIMIRSHTGPQSAHAFLLVTPTTVKGVAFQRRRSDGASSVHTTGPAITAPVWLRLVASGQLVRAYYRTTDTGPWTFVGEDTIAFANSSSAWGGLAVSSHVDGRLAEARFDNVSVRRVPGWAVQDIGSVGVPGRLTVGRDGVLMEASGADIWGTADAFYYYSGSSNTRDMLVSAQVARVDQTHVWAKAGVMFRESLQPNARHVMLIVSPARGVAMQYRAATGGITANVAIVPGAPPKWVRLRRHGQLFIGETSNNGTTWTEVGRVTLAVTATLYEGLAVTSHDNSVRTTALFQAVDVRPLAPGGP